MHLAEPFCVKLGNGFSMEKERALFMEGWDERYFWMSRKRVDGGDGVEGFANVGNVAFRLGLGE